MKDSKYKKSYFYFILYLIFFSIVYINSIIYDYAKNYIIFNNHESLRLFTIIITSCLFLIIPFIALLLIGISKNNVKDTIIDLFVACNVVYIIIPAIIYFSGILKHEDYWVGSVILENGILTMTINPFKLIIDTILYTCTGMAFVSLINDKKVKYIGIFVTSIIVSILFYTTNLINDLTKLAYIPLCIYAQIDKSLVEVSQLPYDKIHEITWLNWFAKFIIPIIIGSLVGLFINAIIGYFIWEKDYKSKDQNSKSEK